MTEERNVRKDSICRSFCGLNDRHMKFHTFPLCPRGRQESTFQICPNINYDILAESLAGALTFDTVWVILRFFSPSDLHLPEPHCKNAEEVNAGRGATAPILTPVPPEMCLEGSSSSSGSISNSLLVPKYSRITFWRQPRVETQLCGAKVDSTASGRCSWTPLSWKTWSFMYIFRFIVHPVGRGLHNSGF